MRWGQQFRFFREEVIGALMSIDETGDHQPRRLVRRDMSGDNIDYDERYPDVLPVMDTRQLAELLHTNEQIVRLWVREGVIPAHRKPGGRKFTFLRHEIFEWLISNRYEPESTSK